MALDFNQFISWNVDPVMFHLGSTPIRYYSFFFFMVFNGTVVFGQGAVRWLGVAITLLLLGTLVTTRPWRTVAS